MEIAQAELVTVVAKLGCVLRCSMSSLTLLVGCLVVACGTPDAGSSSVIPSNSATAHPVVIVRWQSTGGSCADQHTLVPTIVIYADGRVVRTDDGHGLGQYCYPIPTFHTGQVDLAAVRTRVESYLSTQSSKVDMSHAAGVADGGLTSLEYTAVDGSRRLVVADAIDFGLGQMTAEQRGGRTALTATIAAINKLTPTTTRWTPIALSITKPAKWVPRYSSNQAPAWPVPVTTAVQQLSAGPEESCTTLSGPAAEKLYVAARKRTTAAATWTIDRKATFVAIGVVLDGLPPCR